MPELYDNKLTDLPTFPSEPLFEEPPIADVRHGGSLLLFGEIADSFGVNVTDQDCHDWRSVLGAAMVLDHLLDVEDLAGIENASQRLDFVNSFVALMNGQLREDLDRTTQIRAVNYMARQNRERQQAIYRDVLAVDELTKRQRETTKARELVDTRITEADILASLLAINQEGDASDHVARELFNRWVQSWSRVGYTLDSLVDLGDDFKNGESKVEPTMCARGVLASTVTKEGFVAVKRTPLKALGKCALVGVRYVIQENRPEVRASTAPSPA